MEKYNFFLLLFLPMPLQSAGLHMDFFPPPPPSHHQLLGAKDNIYVFLVGTENTMGVWVLH